MKSAPMLERSMVILATKVAWSEAELRALSLRRLMRTLRVFGNNG